VVQTTHMWGQLGLRYWSRAPVIVGSNPTRPTATRVGLTRLSEILNRHVRLFNDGVRTGNFGPMTSHFVDDAEMRFEGIHVGPFRGLRAIEGAYSMQPPDDEIVVLNVKEEPAGIS
jgi:hypothetical protein